MQLWMIIIGSLLALNLVASAVLFLRGAPEAAAAEVQQVSPNAEILIKLNDFRTDFTRFKSQFEQHKAQVHLLQTTTDSIQAALNRLPPPNVNPHPAPPETINAPTTTTPDAPLEAKP